jgi:hypothetical protein
LSDDLDRRNIFCKISHNKKMRRYYGKDLKQQPLWEVLLKSQVLYKMIICYPRKSFRSKSMVNFLEAVIE